jgi:hypothetical protein
MTTTTPLFNKVAFFQDAGYAPHPGQQLVHDSNAPRRVLAAGTRWGKSRAAAMEALAACMEPRDRSYGWVCAPTYELADKVYREIALVAAERLRHRLVLLRESDKRLVVRNLAGGTSEIRAKSADNPVSLLGEGLDWVIVDEAARLKPAIWEGHLSQRLLDKRGWALLISTPKGKGWFYDAFRRGQGDDPDYESWNAPSWENPYLDRSVIEAERERLPERVFLQELGGQFLEGAGQVFRNVRDVATGQWQDPVPGELYYGGLDLAKVEDYTVLVFANTRREVVFADRFHRLDWALQVERIKAAVDRYGGSVIVTVDSTGKGEPVYEQLRMAGLACRAYPFTARSKADLINNLAMMIEREEITLPRPDLWPIGIDELESFEYAITDAGNVKTGAPSGCHDDTVVALALAVWRLRRGAGVQLTV